MHEKKGNEINWAQKEREGRGDKKRKIKRGGGFFYFTRKRNGGFHCFLPQTLATHREREREEREEEEKKQEEGKRIGFDLDFKLRWVILIFFNLKLIRGRLLEWFMPEFGDPIEGWLYEFDIFTVW